MASSFVVDSLISAARAKEARGLTFTLPSAFVLLAALDTWAAPTDQDLSELLFSAAPGLAWVQGPSKSGQGSWMQDGRRLSDADVSVFFLKLAAQISETPGGRWANLTLRGLRNERALRQTINFAKRVSVAAGGAL